MLVEKRDEHKHNVQVLAIVGIGGLGKTTLAKMVYNDQRVQDHFELKMWYCVSQANFDTCSIMKSILELATKDRRDLPDNIELLQRRLREDIGRKRYLLILDDVWNEEEHKWDNDLKQLLCSSIGGSGSRIVATSRSQKVASIMATLPPYDLACLIDDHSWKIFTQKAFSNGVQEQRELVIPGKCVVKKCEGLPLALKIMGGLMSSRQQVREWNDIAQCSLGATASGKDGILSILKLSYMQLTSEMKQCFTFCALFPKDYEMEKDMLIQLWIANGFIQKEETEDLEEKGESIFNYLVWRPFLQHVKILKATRNLHVSKHEIDGCKMHVLMHDLAKDVANECATAEELIQQKVPIKEARHLNMSGTEGMRQLRQIWRLSKGATSFSTLLTPSTAYHNLELKVGSVRALWCHCEDPSIVHNRFSDTAHLQYLDLSWSGISRLPSSICNLYNLKSLRLNNCYRLRYLPEGMTSLTNLRHFYLLECENLEQMPPNLGILQNLRTLTTFVVDTQDGCGIDEIKEMRQLGNRMELYNLRKVKSGSKANLHEKYNLQELSLCWNRKKGVIPKQVNIRKEEEVLGSLLPHKMLKILEIDGYGGQEIPQWMRDPHMFQCLKELVISNCPRYNDLPVVWLSSSSLEHLSLSNMRCLTTLCKKVDTCEQVFPKLRRMKLSHLPELKGWAENSAGEPNKSVMFPQLKELIIYKCYKFAPLLESPCLTHLQLEGSGPVSMPLDSCPSLVSLKVGLQANVVVPQEEQQSKRYLESLQSLELKGDDCHDFISISLSRLHQGLWNFFVEELVISSCSNIDRWPLEELRRFPRLRSLRISRCAGLGREGSSSKETLPLPQLERLLIESCDSLQEIPGLPASLEELDISRCTSLESLPSNLGDLAKLRELHLLGCDRLTALPEGMDDLTSLETLTIKECPRIREFPPGLHQRIPSLKSLTIWDCPDLQKRCRQGGRYFELVSSIRRRSIPAIKPMKATDSYYMLHKAGVHIYYWRV